jgi:hypothetical protein
MAKKKLENLRAMGADSARISFLEIFAMLESRGKIAGFTGLLGNFPASS